MTPLTFCLMLIRNQKSFSIEYAIAHGLKFKMDKMLLQILKNKLESI